MARCCAIAVRDMDRPNKRSGSLSSRLESMADKARRVIPHPLLILVVRKCRFDWVRKQGPQPPPIAARTLNIQTWKMRKTNWPSGLEALIIGTMSCGCSSAVVIRLPATQQIALALRIVFWPELAQIARRFSLSAKRNGSAHHPRQGAHRPKPKSLRSPRPGRRSRPRRVGVARSICCFNRRAIAAGRPHRAPLCDRSDPAGAAVAAP